MFYIRLNMYRKKTSIKTPTATATGAQFLKDFVEKNLRIFLSYILLPCLDILYLASES